MMKQLNQFPWSYKHFEKNSILFWNRNTLQVCLSQHFLTPGHINSTKPMGLLHSFPASEPSIRSHSSSQILWDCVWIRFYGEKKTTLTSNSVSHQRLGIAFPFQFLPKSSELEKLSSVFADCAMLADSLKMTSADTPWHINLHIFCVTIHCEVTPCAHFPPAAIHGLLSTAGMLVPSAQRQCFSCTALAAVLRPKGRYTCVNRMSENVVNKVSLEVLTPRCPG